MNYEIFLIGAALFLTGAAAPDSGHCDSKPFTLKPSPQPRPVAARAATPAPKPAASKPAPVKEAKPKAKYQIGCKQPKN